MIKAILIAAGVAALPLPAIAEVAQDVVTQRVSYAGLDLASPDGRRILQRRIDGAIRNVCGEPVIDLRLNMQIRRCRLTAQRDTAVRVAALTDRREVAFAGIYPPIAAH